MAGITRVAWPTFATAVASSLTAVIVNFATQWQTSVWAWIIAAALTVLSGAMSHILWRTQSKVQNESSDTPLPTGSNDINITRPVEIEHLRVTGRQNRWRSGTLHAKTVIFEAGAQPSIDPQQADSEPSPDPPRHVDSHRELEN